MWQFAKDTDAKDWQYFGDNDADMVERHYQTFLLSGPAQFELLMNKQTYQIDFSIMQQNNLSHAEHRKRSIRRKDIAAQLLEAAAAHAEEVKSMKFVLAEEIG